MEIALEIQKTNVGTRINILKILCVQIFFGKMNKFELFDPICPKMDLELKIQKTSVGIKISILHIPRLPTFRENRQL